MNLRPGSVPRALSTMTGIMGILAVSVSLNVLAPKCRNLLSPEWAFLGNTTTESFDLRARRVRPTTRIMSLCRLCRSWTHWPTDTP